MIVKMQKLTLFVSANHKDDALNKLKKLGLVHIHNINQPISEDITSIETELSNVERSLSIIGLKNIEKSDRSINFKKTGSLVENIISLASTKDQLNNVLEEEKGKFNWFQTWGNVSMSEIEELRNAGIYIRLYTSDKSYLKKLPEDRMIYVVNEDKYKVYLALVSTEENSTLDLKEEIIPADNLKSVKDKIASTEKELLQINKKINDLSEFQADILAYQEKIKKRYEFANVKYGMENEESISYLQGFCPEESTDIIKKEADKESWGYVFEEPDDLSEVPTLIKNPRWIKIIDPIFKFMGTVPGYQEYDISMWFLIFFSLFFAMLIGDAGYGFIFIVLTLWARRKMPKAPSEPFILMYILGGATVIWGLLSGTWFGLERIAQIPFLKKCIIPSISSFDLSKHSFNDNQNIMMQLCFLIGAIHLTVAHLTSALRNKKSLRALSQIGWIGIVWSLYFLAGTLVLRHEFPKMAKWPLLIGFFLALVFTNPQKNIIKGVASTLGSLPLDIIGAFSDVVSYLRLFAVGYATVMVAYSFNTMALGNGINNIISGFIAAFILFLGHGLNIILGAMSIVVHGIRLNMLEFSGHLGMEWSGKEYKPFKE